MSYSSFKIILIHVKNIIPIITATLILNYLNNSERSLVKQILIEDEISVCATYLIPDIYVEEKNTCLRAYLSIVLLHASDGGYEPHHERCIARRRRWFTYWQWC